MDTLSSWPRRASGQSIDEVQRDVRRTELGPALYRTAGDRLYVFLTSRPTHPERIHLAQLEGIDHVALAVRDVRRSAAWYKEVLGLERLYEEAWGDLPAVIGIGRTAIALFPARGSDPKPVPGKDVLAMRHLAFRADRENFAKVRLELEERGLRVEFQDHGIAHSIYFHDPDGHELEITTYDLTPVA